MSNQPTRDITIYHNPRCSKSRQTLALLQENGIEPTIVEYLKDAPSVATLTSLQARLGVAARDMMRTGEAIYKDQNLADTGLSDADLIQAMHNEPILIERPIVATEARAVIGRPPENALELL